MTALVRHRGLEPRTYNLMVVALPAELMAVWWPLLGLNQRPSDYESRALTN